MHVVKVRNVTGDRGLVGAVTLTFPTGAIKVHGEQHFVRAAVTSSSTAGCVIAKLLDLANQPSVQVGQGDVLEISD